MVLLTLVFAGALGALPAGVRWYYRRERFEADDAGLRVQSRRGDRRLAWEDVLELGWVTPSQYRGGGLAGRLREGGPYDVPGPAIAGWRCRPIGRVQPDALHDLAELAWRHGVTWRDAPAPRSCDGAVVRRGAERCRRTGRVPGGTGGGPPVQRADQPPSSMKEEPLAKDATSEHR